MGAMSSYSSPNPRTDRPLVVKCDYNRKIKKVTFRSARSCTILSLRQKIQEGFSLSASQFIIKWKDDDGEYTLIEADGDLDDAIKFHQVGDEASTSSGASILSYRSSRTNKITLPVEIHVDYDGPSLSDSSSLSSREEFEERDNGDRYTISLSGPSSLPEDDAQTNSSRDTGPSSLLRKLMIPSSRSLGSSSQNRTQRQLKKPRSRLFGLSSRSGENPFQGPDEDDASTTLGTDPITGGSVQRSHQPNGQAVFAQLKAEQRQEVPSLIPWLREQSSRQEMFAPLHATPGPAPYDTDSFSLNTDTPFSDGDGPFADNLSLEINQRGQKYYSYRSGSSDVSRDFGDFETHVLRGRAQRGPRPFSFGALSSESGDNPSSGYPMSSTQSSRHFSLQYSVSDPGPHMPPLPPLDSTFSIPPELLIPDEVTDCSECGEILESMRYICTTCGDKPSLPRYEMERMGKGKGKSREEFFGFSATHEYPPPSHRSGSSSSFSSDTLRTLIAQHPRAGRNPVHDHHRSPRSPSSATSLSSTSTLRSGYELCSMCIQTKGVEHSLFGGMEEEDLSGKFGKLNSQQELSIALRSAPHQKGHLRHAFAEKHWGPDGWQDLDQGDATEPPRCSGCATQIHKDGYRCAVCDYFALCRGCYSDVHNIHPRHAFLIMPDRPLRSKGEPALKSFPGADNVDEPSLKHPDVVCHHCGQDIVGARFKCLDCLQMNVTVNICSNCETTGLPGNLEDDWAGHNSSHVMIKFPVPLSSAEEQSATRNVRMLASRDPNGRPRSSPSSVSSLMAKTVLRENIKNADPEDHLVMCNSCGMSIVGARFQCLSCPSKSSSYNLCGKCEVKSYILHDPKHIFLMLNRPVDNPRPLQSETPLIPFDLYKEPVGPTHEQTSNPEDYLQTLTHSFAYCNRHMTHINGRWYRCAYCEVSRDLCAECYSYDSHDPTHAFIVFKAPVDIKQFRAFANLDSSDNKSPPVLNGPIYYS
ncbi:hypothetical protein K488DRAFT_83186 [Vararia minispora EC-137]|uniref:Uncharacterized protein n=1 Tax=Vararia minispora EC-137 TaxID=1314806 RepID=A0ACB8QUB1_9AGAM|nr:hypothetical protein K488DRAFT_83186 [Vararia minispora EC-137]